MERKILDLVALDRIDIPLSSLEHKVRGRRKKTAESLAETLGTEYTGQRVYAYVRDEDKQKARGMAEAIKEFSEQYPKYGAILNKKIREKRTERETHLYFGVNEGKRLSSDDYMFVMESIGLSKSTASALYPVLMDVSRKLSRVRDEERSIIVG